MIVRYYGHVGLPTGYGQAANEMCMALLSAGIELEISTDGKQLHQRYLPLASRIRNESDLSPHPDVVIVHTLPIDCGKLVLTRELLGQAGALVAYTTWEGITPIPATIASPLSHFDSVWTPSHLGSQAIDEGQRAIGLIPPSKCMVVPHPYDDTLYADRVPSPPAHDGIFRFYYVGAWTMRKNVEGVIYAFLRAFEAGEPVELIIHSAGAPREGCDIARIATGLDPRETPTIRFSNERLSDEAIRALHDECDCFVTATRGEAWNLPAFDAVLAKRHIISPVDLGSDHFLMDTSAWLYRSDWTPAIADVRFVESSNTPPGHRSAVCLRTQGMTVRSSWLQPDIAVLSEMMRRAFGSRISDLRVHYEPAERYGRRAVGELARDLLQGVIP